MYVPAHFAADDEAVHELLANHGAADLVTMTPDGLVATMLPFVYERSSNVGVIDGLRAYGDEPGADAVAKHRR